MTKWPKGRALGLGVAALLVAVGAALLGTAGLVSSQQGATVQIQGATIMTGQTEVTRLEAVNVSPGMCGFTVDVTYPPSIKEPVPTGCTQPTPPVFGAWGCETAYDADTVRVAGGVGTPEGLSGTVALADIVWLGLAPGQGPLTVQVVSFVDCSIPPAAIPASPGAPGTNVVESPTATPTPPPETATPTPTPSPTPTATATATPTATATVTVTATGTVTPPVETATPVETVIPPTETVIPPTETAIPPTTMVPATGTPVVTPAAPPPTGGGGTGSLSDLPWATALAAGAILAWVLAAASVFHTVRRRSG